MTDRRDFKRRVRARQARTGESYVTALQHVRAQRPARVPMIELVDLTAVGKALGLGCRVSMFPQLRETIDPPAMLARLRDVLFATERDPALALMREVVLRGELGDVRWSADMIDRRRAFLERAHAGIGGVSESGCAMALPSAGGSTVLFVLWPTPMLVATPWRPLLIVASPGDLVGQLELDAP